MHLQIRVPALVRVCVCLCVCLCVCVCMHSYVVRFRLKATVRGNGPLTARCALGPCIQHMLCPASQAGHTCVNPTTYQGFLVVENVHVSIAHVQLKSGLMLEVDRSCQKYVFTFSLVI